MNYTSLLKIAKLEEDEFADKVTSLEEKIYSINQKIGEVESTILKYEKDTLKPKDIFHTMSALNYVNVLSKELKTLNIKKNDLQHELNNLNKIYIEKKIERKGIEKLILKREAMQVSIENKKEQSFLDELNTID